MICIRIHENAVLKPAIHHDVTVVVVLVCVIRIRWLTIYTEAEEPYVFESTVHHTAVFSNHPLKLHINDIKIDKVELSDFCHSDIHEEMLLAYCGCYGVDSSDVELLLEYGYSCDEIEEMLNDHPLLNEALCDVKYICGEEKYESCYGGAW